MKLKNFVSNIFRQKSLKQTLDVVRDFNTLERYLPEIFPEDTEWGVILDMLELLDREDTKAQTADFLPFHTRDNQWLAKYVYATVKDDDPKSDIKFANVKKYVATSDDFDSFRRHYEENLTREQIQFIYNDYVFSGENSYFKHLNEQKNNFDKAFRNEVIKTLTYMGVDEHSVEIGLEKNASLWRERAMMHTFNNRFYPDDAPRTNDKSLWRNNIQNIREHRKAWMQLRECMYYQEHKAILDELGLVTKNMRISDNEYTALSRRVIEYYRKHYETAIDTLAEDIQQKQNPTAKNIDNSREI